MSKKGKNIQYIGLTIILIIGSIIIIRDFEYFLNPDGVFIIFLGLNSYIASMFINWKFEQIKERSKKEGENYNGK